MPLPPRGWDILVKTGGGAGCITVIACVKQDCGMQQIQAMNRHNDEGKVFYLLYTYLNVDPEMGNVYSPRGPAI